MARPAGRSSTGSSPLTRGKPTVSASVIFVVGLIPAHAGKTPRLDPTSCNSWAHPRSRGENLSRRAVQGSEPGSSPLTRGKPDRRRRRPQRTRLIPAHAGKTLPEQRDFPRSRAHPRSRGENVVAETKNFSRAGSSPLTRGKQVRHRRWQRKLGLIPAHAGKTRAMRIDTVPSRAHPRSRGENAIVVGMVREGMGSSPLTRGKPPAAGHVVSRGGLIPAHAGKTPVLVVREIEAGAHPRSRGENSKSQPAPAAGMGSSPLTRGKHVKDHAGQGLGGLIPAHAGKTGSAGLRWNSDRAHPRSRGENRGAGGGDKVGAGSSPLTRGKLCALLSLSAIARLIPAHAGKTIHVVMRLRRSRAHPRSRGENLEWHGQIG